MFQHAARNMLVSNSIVKRFMLVNSILISIERFSFRSHDFLEVHVAEDEPARVETHAEDGEDERDVFSEDVL